MQGAELPLHPSAVALLTSATLAYRLREKLKAGLLKPKPGPDHGNGADGTGEQP